MEKKVKLGSYEVVAEKKANPYAILALSGTTFLPLLLKELKIAYKTETKTSKRGSEYEIIVGKTKENNTKINQLRSRIQYSIMAEYAENSEVGFVTNQNVFDLGKVKKIPAPIRERIQTDFNTAKTTKKTNTKTAKVSAKVVISTGQKFSMAEVKDMALLKGVSVQAYVKFLRLEGHTVTA